MTFVVIFLALVLLLAFIGGLQMLFRGISAVLRAIAPPASRRHPIA